jgi:zinc D-Ala-D-Ala carboxypeptidase
MTTMTPTISEHFTYEELTRSQTALRRGFDNTPNVGQIENLHRLAIMILEPVRNLLGVPMQVDSGFRCPELNAAVGGAEQSAHLDVDACDFVPIGMSLQEAFDRIRHSPLPYDQIIIECNAWIHIGIAPTGRSPRRQALTASGHAGAWHYEEVSHG